jgi:hypothetical protein
VLEPSADCIFEPGERTETRPMRHTEGLWAHLNRRGSPGYDGVRELINDWYSHVPQGKGRRDLFAKLRSSRGDTWYAGFWELYLHEAISRAGYELEIEPDVPGSSRHPDFLVRGHGHEFYIEALAITEDPSSPVERRRRHIYDYLNESPHPNFWVSFSIRREGASAPPVRRLLADITRWLDGLDPDITPSDTSFDWHHGGWWIHLRALAKSPEARTFRSDGLIGIQSGWAGPSDMGSRIREKLHSKATRYGKLDKPYLIALTASSFLAEDEELVTALLGPEEVQYLEGQPGSAQVVRKRDGLFMAAGGAQNRRVAGLIVAWNVTCTHIGFIRPTLWLNPWVSPDRSFSAPLPFDRMAIDSETAAVTPQPQDFDPLPYFGLPADWPGFEDRPIGTRRIL